MFQFQFDNDVVKKETLLAGCTALSWTNYTVDQLVMEQVPTAIWRRVLYHPNFRGHFQESCHSRSRSRSRLYQQLQYYAQGATCRPMNLSHPNVMIDRLNIKIYAFHRYKREITGRIFQFQHGLKLKAQEVQCNSRFLEI